MTIEQIIAVVSKETGITIAEIVDSSRKADAVAGRHISMWACRWYSGEPLQKIAAAHNRKQHGSVINASNSIDYQIKRNKELNSICQAIASQVK